MDKHISQIIAEKYLRLVCWFFFKLILNKKYTYTCTPLLTLPLDRTLYLSYFSRYSRDLYKPPIRCSSNWHTHTHDSTHLKKIIKIGADLLELSWRQNDRPTNRHFFFMDSAYCAIDRWRSQSWIPNSKCYMTSDSETLYNLLGLFKIFLVVITSLSCFWIIWVEQKWNIGKWKLSCLRINN